VIATRPGFPDRRERRVFAVEDMTDEQIAAIEKAQMPPGHGASRCRAERLESAIWPRPEAGLVMRYSYLPAIHRKMEARRAHRARDGFLDLCALLGHDDPMSADPTGARSTACTTTSAASTRRFALPLQWRLA
jgi:hypothetical protein